MTVPRAKSSILFLVALICFGIAFVCFSHSIHRTGARSHVRANVEPPSALGSDSVSFRKSEGAISWIDGRHDEDEEIDVADTDTDAANDVDGTGDDDVSDDGREEDEGGDGAGRSCDPVPKGKSMVNPCLETVVLAFAVPFFGETPPWTGWTWCDASVGANVLTVSGEAEAAAAADAVVYHARDVDLSALLPRATPQQPRVLLTVENQQVVDRWEQEAGVMAPFDLLVSFHLSSDVHTSYLGFDDRQEAMHEEPLPFVKRRKDALVAWAASNCAYVANYRQPYFAELGKHVSTHVFGKCDPTATFRSEHRVEQDKELREYMFYFSAENLVCDDYVTEKFFRPLAHGVVPIVYGAPNIAVLAPTNDSYIDVRDFASPAKLAAYLRALASDRTRYERFFRWKSLPFDQLNPGFRRLLEEKPWPCSLAALLRANRDAGKRYTGGLRPVGRCDIKAQSPGWDRRELDRDALAEHDLRVAKFWPGEKSLHPAEAPERPLHS